MEKDFNLSDTIYEGRWIHKDHVKEKIQNAQRRLREEFFNKKIINKIFLEEFGAKLII